MKQFIFLLILVGSFNLVTGQTSDSTDEQLCKDFLRIKDDFTGEVRISTPGYISTDIGITKYITKGVTTYYLSLYAHGSTYVVDGKGAYIIFADGTRWSKPAIKIDVDLDTPNNRYWAFIKMTPADLMTFSTKTISKYRLYIFDQGMENEAATKFACFTKQLKVAK